MPYYRCITSDSIFDPSSQQVVAKGLSTYDSSTQKVVSKTLAVCQVTESCVTTGLPVCTNSQKCIGSTLNTYDPATEAKYTTATQDVFNKGTQATYTTTTQAVYERKTQSTYNIATQALYEKETQGTYSTASQAVYDKATQKPYSLASQAVYEKETQGVFNITTQSVFNIGNETKCPLGSICDSQGKAYSPSEYEIARKGGDNNGGGSDNDGQVKFLAIIGVVAAFGVIAAAVGVVYYCRYHKKLDEIKKYQVKNPVSQGFTPVEPTQNPAPQGLFDLGRIGGGNVGSDAYRNQGGHTTTINHQDIELSRINPGNNAGLQSAIGEHGSDYFGNAQVE